MEDYPAAALRHWQDATLLEGNRRLENADHHYGFAAECAVKCVLERLPRFMKNGSLDTCYKTHINVLWGKIHLSSLQNSHANLLAVLKTNNSFSNWDVNQRYAADGHITQEVMDAHKKSAKRILGSIGLTGTRAI